MFTSNVELMSKHTFTYISNYNTYMKLGISSLLCILRIVMTCICCTCSNLFDENEKILIASSVIGAEA